ncbi:MAG: hypothetical protein BWX79_02870 [Alphaproteobacteria bacterium ADurb.Bin100]|nr:MAG: hypothetical protein BWX79_02870 [Alphaproteobacteria bacterium ADurb.Bin100]
MLVHKGHLDGGADDDLAAVRFLLAGNQLEQCRLAGPVGADDADDGARRDGEGQVVDQHPVAERLGHIVELEHLVAQALGDGNEYFLGLVALLVVIVAELFETRQTRLALGLAALGVLSHPLELLLHRLGPRILAAVFLLQARLFLLQPGAVVALVGNAGAPVEFENPLGGVVQEVTVVGDGHHGAGKAGKKLLQPVHRFGVQVVGRLIEQQHVGAAEQQPAQRHTALLTTRQFADHGLPGRQAQRIGGNFQLVFGGVSRGGNDGLQLGLFGRQRFEIGIFLGVSRVDLVQALLRRLDLSHATFNGLPHGLVRIHLGLLRQVSDLQARHGDGFALDLLVQSGHDLEQRGLA